MKETNDLEQGLPGEEEGQHDNPRHLEQGVSLTPSDSEEEEEPSAPPVVFQQSGYATDVVAIRDVVGNVHTTVFHVCRVSVSMSLLCFCASLLLWLLLLDPFCLGSFHWHSVSAHGSWPESEGVPQWGK